MSNHYFELYKKHCTELEPMMKQYQGNIDDAKKLRGAVAVALLREEINKYFIDNEEPFRTSLVNSYIMGSKFEYDLLLVKENAKPYMDLIYQPDDVVAIIESKAGGLFNVDKDTNSIAKAVNRAMEINSDIKFGYITLSENVPVHPYNHDGNPTVKHWDLTQEYFKTKISGVAIIYAVTLHKGKKLCDEGSDNEFFDFIKNLIED